MSFLLLTVLLNRMQQLLLLEIIFQNECFTAIDLPYVITTKQLSIGFGIHIISKHAYKYLLLTIRFARKLTEFFVISVLNRIERNEMDHLKKIQEEKNYRKILAKEYIAALESGLWRAGGPNARLGKVFMMPQTFAGSRQYYQQKYANLMTIVRRLGNPTWL